MVWTFVIAPNGCYILQSFLKVQWKSKYTHFPLFYHFSYFFLFYFVKIFIFFLTESFTCINSLKKSLSLCYQNSSFSLMLLFQEEIGCLLNINSTKRKRKATDNLHYSQKHNIFTARYFPETHIKVQGRYIWGKNTGFVCGRIFDYFDILTPETQVKVADTLKDWLMTLS